MTTTNDSAALPENSLPSISQPTPERSHAKDKSLFVASGSFENFALGVPPRHIDCRDVRDDLSSEADSIQEIKFTTSSLKEMILDPDNIVKIRPILLALSGFPGSGKNKAAIEHLLKNFVETSPYIPPAHRTKEAQGIAFYDILAYGDHPLTLVEMTVEHSFAFGLLTAFKRKIIDHKTIPSIPVRPGEYNQQEKPFEDSALENHLQHVYQHICLSASPENESSNGAEEKKRASRLRQLPSGTSLINVWSIDINKTALYCLHALFGHLYNSNTWLFLDIEQESDIDKLDEPPDDTPQPKSQGAVAIKWRPRLHYFLRTCKLSCGDNDHDRKDVCTIFATYGGKFNGKLKEKLESKVKRAARQMGVSDLLKSEIQPINLATQQNDSKRSKNGALLDFSQQLYQNFYQMVCNTHFEEIPLSWVFLRSMYYVQKQTFISKSVLRSKAKECGITDESFEKFCHTYASFGSIIDFTFINPEHKLIVLQPIDFLRSLDKILHPGHKFYEDYQMMENGIVSETVCQEVFEVSSSDYMNALISMGLAVKVTGSCDENIKIPPSHHTDTLYYVPEMRKNYIDEDVSPTAIYLITSVDSPHISIQVGFVKKLLALRQIKLMPCKEENKTTILDVLTDTLITIVSFSPAIKIEISATSEEVDKVYSSVVEACHEITKSSEKRKVKYEFITICKEAGIITPRSIPFCRRHILPNKYFCSTCGEPSEQLQAWNKALSENPTPDDCHIEDVLEDSHIYIITEEIASHPEKLAEMLGLRTDDPVFSGLSRGMLVMEMILTWYRQYIEQHQSNEGSRRALARLFLEMGNSLSDVTLEKESFLRVARALDAYAK